MLFLIALWYHKRYYGLFYFGYNIGVLSWSKVELRFIAYDFRNWEKPCEKDCELNCSCANKMLLKICFCPSNTRTRVPVRCCQLSTKQTDWKINNSFSRYCLVSNTLASNVIYFFICIVITLETCLCKKFNLQMFLPHGNSQGQTYFGTSYLMTSQLPKTIKKLTYTFQGLLTVISGRDYKTRHSLLFPIYSFQGARKKSVATERKCFLTK